jgi:hypothetical protein
VAVSTLLDTPCQGIIIGGDFFVLTVVVGTWQGVAVNSLGFHPGAPCLTSLPTPCGRATPGTALRPFQGQASSLQPTLPLWSPCAYGQMEI